MNLWDTCRSCNLCEVEKPTETDNLLYGNPDSSILFIGNRLDFEHLLDEEFARQVEHLDWAALTFTVKCPIEMYDGDGDEIDIQDSIDMCSIYTRNLTYAFSIFVVCEEAWYQIGLDKKYGEYKNGATVNTHIGIVRCANNVLPMLTYIESYEIAKKKYILDRFPEPKKALRKQILDR